VTDRPQPSGLSGPTIAAILIAAAQTPLGSTMIAVALPEIGARFAVGLSIATSLLVSAYMVLNVVGQSPGGKLADLFGRWRTLEAGIVICAFGALIGTLAPAFWPLVPARCLMALGGALIAPAVLSLIRAHAPPGRRGKMFGAYSAVVGLAAAIGPPLGGALVEAFGWRAIFAVNLPFLAAALLMVRAADRPADARPLPGSFGKVARDFDWLGAALLAAALALLASSAWWALALAAAIVLAFVFGEQRARDPILDPKLFANPVFAASCAVIFLQSLAMYGLIFQLPQAFEALGGATARESGLILFVMMAGLFVASAAGGALADRFGARLVALSGALLLTVGIAWLASRPSFANPAEGWAPLLLAGLGVGLAWAPAQSAAMSAIEEARSGMAAGATTTCRYLGGAIGALILAAAVGTVGPASLATHVAVLWVFCSAAALSIICAFALPAGASPNGRSQARR
jgi:MFS family permease